MKASELVKILQDVINEHGDVSLVRWRAQDGVIVSYSKYDMEFRLDPKYHEKSIIIY